jgi:hypothetical protein
MESATEDDAFNPLFDVASESSVSILDYALAHIGLLATLLELQRRPWSRHHGKDSQRSHTPRVTRFYGYPIQGERKYGRRKKKENCRRVLEMMHCMQYLGSGKMFGLKLEIHDSTPRRRSRVICYS